MKFSLTMRGQYSSLTNFVAREIRAVRRTLQASVQYNVNPNVLIHAFYRRTEHALVPAQRRGQILKKVQLIGSLGPPVELNCNRSTPLRLPDC
jgi:hypothetical protein